MTATARMAYMAYNSHSDRQQAATLVSLLLANGCKVSVNDGEEWVLKQSTDKATILAAMGSTDNDTLGWRDADGNKLGSFWLVYGNGPGELVADHTANDACESLWNAWSAKHPG